jgi:hypothetical protein
MSDNASEVINFKPYKRLVENVPQEIKQAAQVHKVPVESIDIDIAAVNTQYRTKKDTNWSEATKDVLKKIETPKYMLMPTLQLQQTYEIIFRPAIENTPLQLNYNITSDEYKSKIMARITSEQPFSRHPKIGSMLLEEINKKKLKLGLVINIFDKSLKEKLRTLSEEIKNGEEIDSFDVVISECSAPTSSVNDKLIEHFKIAQEEKQKKEDGSVDHSDRGFAVGVYEGELILEYQKPILGKNGRNCLGEFIEAPKPTMQHKPQFKIGHGIEIDENDMRILYKAAIVGSVVYEPGLLDITDKIKMNGASFRGSGTINVGKDKDIALEIESKDDTMDSIASGVRVECTELNVKGVVGAGAEVHAKRVFVDGMTHAKAIIEVDENAEISHHRGKLTAKEAHIINLEGGVVRAEVVKIDKSNGGEIEAQRIYVKELGSNTILKASELIEIELITGDANKCIIDPTGVTNHTDKMEGYSSKLKDLENELLSVMGDYDHIQNELLSEKEWLTQLKQMLARKEIQLQSAHKVRIKAYQIKEGKLNDYQLIINEITGQQRAIREEIQYYDALILKAKIHCKSSWTEHNEVRFIHPQADEPYVLSPRPEDNKITLVKSGDDEYELHKEFFRIRCYR